MERSEPTPGAVPPSRALHVPVMLEEALYWLDATRGQCVVDGTLGAGGHAARIAAQLGHEGHLIGLDRDANMIELARPRVSDGRVTLVQANYADLRDVLDELNIAAVDGVLLDLGVCSDQLAAEGRGFSFADSGPLDLRFDRSHGEPAYRVLNRYSAERLADIFWEFGEERYSRRIAAAIAETRNRREIRTAQDLADIVRKAVPPQARRQRIHPATRVFQALRIAVNDELDCLARALRQMPQCLREGGRLVVISFQSLEDRLVKQALRDKTLWEVLTRRPIRPTQAEVRANPRARSAKLRAGRKHKPDGA